MSEWEIVKGDTFEIARRQGEQVVSDDEGLTSFTSQKIPWSVLDQLRKLRDERVDARIDEEAQV